MILLATASGTGRVGDTGGLTATTLIVIAIFAVLVIAGILWGAKQKRDRVAGEQAGTGRPEPRIAAPLPPAPPPLTESIGIPQSLVAPPPAKATRPAAKPKAAAKPVATAPVAKVAPAAKPAAKVPVAKTAAPPPPKTSARAATPAVAVTVPKPATKLTAARPAPKAASATATKPAAAKSATVPPVSPAPAAPKPAAPKPTKAEPAAATAYGLIDVKGLGPKAVPMLEKLGVADLKALAGLNAARAAEIDGQLGVLSGRLTRDRWVAQAKLLAAGKTAEFEQAYGKL